MKIGIFAAAITLGATGVLAEPPEGSDAPERAAEQAASVGPAEQVATAVDAAPQEERKICRTEKATGSLTRRNRICLTQTQWREIYDNTRRGVGELQGSASGSPACVSQMDVACLGPEAMGVPGS